MRSSPRRSLVVLATLAAFTLTTGVARPASARKARPKPAPAETADERAAREHYERGQTHYEMGEFDLAIDDFKQAYALSKRPALLFNIAQAYRGKGDHAQAVYFYTTYLRLAPDSPQREYVEARVAEEQAAIDHPGADATPLTADPPAGDPPRKPAPAEPATKQPPASASMRPPRDSARANGRARKIGGLITLGAGVVLVATGAWFASEASAASDELTRLYRDGGTWDAHYADLYDSGARDETAAIVLFTAGGTALVGGAILYWLGWRADRHATTVSVGASPGGARLALGWVW